MSVDVKQQIRIRGGHRAYVKKLLKRVPENRTVEDLSKGKTFSTGRLGQVYFGARRGRQH